MLVMADLLRGVRVVSGHIHLGNGAGEPLRLLEGVVLLLRADAAVWRCRRNQADPAEIDFTPEI